MPDARPATPSRNDRLPDRRALEYLVNRVMGKPTARVEQDLTVDGKLQLRAE